MGIFTRRQKVKVPDPMALPSSYSFPYFTGGEIQKNTTVQACVNAIANPISILPLNLYFKNPTTGARQKAAWHELYMLMKRKPNSWESPTLFIAKMLRHILQHGNAYIWRGMVDGKIGALQLLNPESVKRDVSLWPQVRYWYNRTPYTDAEILHIPSLITDDTGLGISPVDLAKAAVTLGIQLDQYSLNGFANGLNTKLLIDIKEMSKDAKNTEEASKIAATVSDYIRRNYAGAENAGKPLITWAGMETKELTHQSSNRDAELLESRKWQEIEICKIFGVPPWMVNGSYAVPYGGLEPAMMMFLNFTLSPYLRHIEQRLDTLLTAYEQEAYYFEFDFNVLLRPDEKSRGEFYTKLFNMGAISPAGICAKENLDPPSEAGDTRFVPAQLMPLNEETIDAYMAQAKATLTGFDNENSATGAGVNMAGGSDTDQLAAAAGADVSSTALNGAQVTALLDIAGAVAAKTMPLDTAIEIVLIAFPTIDRDEATAMLKPLASFTLPAIAGNP
jgi:HK97 family phage portal protein